MAVERGTKVVALSFVLFCCSLFLSSYSAKNPGFASMGTAMLTEIQKPVQQVASSSAVTINELWENYFALVGIREKYEELTERIKALEEQRERQIEIENENQRLQKLLGIVTERRLESVLARVIGYDPSNWVQAMTIARGSNDKITRGSAVITSEGIVGQVIAVGPTSSKVLLVTDPSSGVDALLQSSRARGVIEGAGRRTLRWRFVLEGEEVKLGERVVTSGMDGVYPPGLVVGVVTEVGTEDSSLFQNVEIAPAVDFGRLEEVIVVPREGEEQHVGGLK